MKVQTFTVNPFGENTYLVWDEVSRDALIIDPGMMQTHERDVVARVIVEQRLVMKMVLLTHIHIDHAASARWMADEHGITVAASRLDEALAQQLPEQARRFRLSLPVASLAIDRGLEHGDHITLGGETLQVLAMPGHSPGGLAFHAPKSGVCFTGDSIFEGSIGRTDLAGGDLDTLLGSIRRNILTLPPETVLAPGHGRATTVANERDFNPYL